jgi:hypothetical protein
MSPFKQSNKYRSYDEVQFAIRNADVLLYRKRGVISIAGRGIHSHCELAGRLTEEVWCIGFREFKGGRAVPLKSQVKRFPKRIDVYTANAGDRWPEFDEEARRKTVSYLADLCEKDYGYYGVLKASFLHLPVIRLFSHAVIDDTAEPLYPPFCSDAIARATRNAGGVDTVQHLADWQTEPADLARSIFYKYFCTLIP